MSEVPQTRPVATPQVAELHQENQPANATTALGCVVAPVNAGIGTGLLGQDGIVFADDQIYTPEEYDALYGGVPDITGIGQPGFWEGVIPVWGSGRAAIDDFQNGRYVWGTINAGLAVTDVFLIKGILVGVVKITGKQAVRKGVVAFARGTADSAFTPNRLQHASRHLIRSGVLPNWSKKTGELFKQIGSSILENPIKTFDHVLHDAPVKGFIGQLNGQNVVIYVFKDGQYAGQVATAIVPNAAQAAKLGL